MTQLSSVAMVRTGLQALVIWLSLTVYATATEVRFPSAGMETTEITGTMYRPDGPGPFPAVVLMHGCSGILPLHHWWAATLQKWGYVALLVDSLGPRGVSEVCTDPMRVSPHARRFDAYGALFYLQGQPFVAPKRVGIIGWAHGGWTVRKAILKPWLNVFDFPHGAFRAAVALYPECGGSGPFYPPLLILIGDQDDWMPAASCTRLVKQLSEGSAPVTLKIYPGAPHRFDSAEPLHSYNGHQVGRHPEASAQAEKDVGQFLAQHLKGD